MPKKTNRTATSWIAGLMVGVARSVAKETFVFADTLVDEAAFAITGDVKKKRK